MICSVLLTNFSLSLLPLCLFFLFFLLFLFPSFPLDPQWWCQFAIFCGTIEWAKYTAQNEGKSYLQGDSTPFWDPASIYPREAKERRRMEEKEIKNARLAMIGIASFVSHRFIPGSVPLIDIMPASWGFQ